MELPNGYKDLIVWQKSMDLVEQVYKATRLFPHNELYGLTSQIRRAATSIPSNIAEGSSRRSVKDRMHFLSIAYGSALELETELLICHRLKYSSDEQLGVLNSLLSEILRMLNKMTSLDLK
jgi:four helix bundle protein